MTLVMCGPASFFPPLSGILLFQHALPLLGCGLIKRLSVLSNYTCIIFRLGAIVAPLLANLGDSPSLPMAVYGLVSGLACLASIGLGPETMGVTTLPDTLEEGERWGEKISRSEK